MGSNSLVRRVLKRALFPLTNERSYRWVQAIAMSWDIRRGTWGEPELDLIPLAVQPGDVAVDVGANYGIYAFHLSKAVGRAGRVWAFEPVPFTFETLKLVARFLRFRNVELVQKGCSDRSGTALFEVPLQTSGAMSAGQAHLSGRNNDREGRSRHVPGVAMKTVQCELVALDDFLPPGIDVSFLKLDIEGAELLALRGATRLIERCRPTIVCEINPWFLDGFGIPLRDLWDFLETRGYEAFNYRLGTLQSARFEEVVEDNYVFVHRTRREKMRSLLPSASRTPGETCHPPS